MTSGQRVSVVIPVYNQLSYTKQCLESIQGQSQQPGEVIVVDNGSTDGTAEYLRQAGVHVISNPRNLGCAKAWNQGIRASHGDIIGILNNDIVVTAGWLGNLLAFMGRTGHGIVSPAAREGTLDYDIESYAQEFTRQCAGATRSEAYSPCMLIARHVFDRVGLFDEEFSYGGCEDTDFLWRVGRAGFTCGMTGSAFIHHFGMVTQDAIKRMETRAYPQRNLDHFVATWKRTVRGNWAERRWTDFKAAMIRRYERLRYGHALLEKPVRASRFRANSVLGKP